MPQLIEAPRRSVSGRHSRADRTAAGVAPDSRRQRSAGHANAAGRARPTWEMPCSCAGLRVPRNPSLPSSEAEPGGQGRPDRAERSEPRSGALDGRAERSYPGRRRLSGRRVHLRSSTESLNLLADHASASWCVGRVGRAGRMRPPPIADDRARQRLQTIDETVTASASASACAFACEGQSPLRGGPIQSSRRRSADLLRKVDRLAGDVRAFAAVTVLLPDHRTRLSRLHEAPLHCCPLG